MKIWQNWRTLLPLLIEGKQKDGGWLSTLLDAQWRGMKELQTERPSQPALSAQSHGCYIRSRQDNVEEWERVQGRCGCPSLRFLREDTKLAASRTSVRSHGRSRGWARATLRLICLPGSCGQPCYVCLESCTWAGRGIKNRLRINQNGLLKAINNQKISRGFLMLSLSICCLQTIESFIHHALGNLKWLRYLPSHREKLCIDIKCWWLFFERVMFSPLWLQDETQLSHPLGTKSLCIYSLKKRSPGKISWVHMQIEEKAERQQLLLDISLPKVYLNSSHIKKTRKQQIRTYIPSRHKAKCNHA